MKLLVTGGAGYIGTALVKHLQERGHAVTAFDNLSTGSRHFLSNDDLVVGDVRDRRAISAVLRDRQIEAVLHLASQTSRAAALQDPSSCYSNSILATQVLLDAMVEHGVYQLVYASSASIYGMPVRVPVDEEHPKAPLEPSGATKWMCEQMFEHWRNAHGVQTVSLRWYGTAGADPTGRYGPGRAQEGDLIPRLLRSCSGRAEALPIHGTDYATRDGTCVRDLLHVNDVCDALALALHALQSNRARAAYNIGTGRGYSVREIILAAERVTGREISIRTAPRRPGDMPVLVADASAARRELGWKPRYSDLDSIISHALNWEERLGARREQLYTRSHHDNDNSNHYANDGALSRHIEMPFAHSIARYKNPARSASN